MAPKLWRESYSAKGMHALIDYHRSDILPSNVERLCPGLSVSAVVSWDTPKFVVPNRTHLSRSGQADG